MRVDWVLLDEAAQSGLEPGDLVSIEAGGLPFWRVMKVTEGRAWLRDEEHGVDCIAPINLFHWKALLFRF